MEPIYEPLGTHKSTNMKDGIKKKVKLLAIKVDMCVIFGSEIWTITNKSLMRHDLGQIKFLPPTTWLYWGYPAKRALSAMRKHGW